MRLTYTITCLLFFVSVLIFGMVQQRSNVDFAALGRSLSQALQSAPGQNYEVAELERQAALRCGQ